jgi:hypothetical protein
MNSAVIHGVREGLEQLGKDRDLRVLIIRGSGEESMIGGADIREMAKLEWVSAEKFITGLRDVCEAVRQFPTPVIARLRGWCLGGGLEFAAACDIRIASQDAKFAMPEVKVRIPLRYPCRATAAIDRLGPRTLADPDRRDGRRARRSTGDWSIRSSRKTTSIRRSCEQQRRSRSAVLTQCEARKHSCGNGKNFH